MPRPPLPIGERGTIKRSQLPDGTWQALCRFRDADGVTRRVKATGSSGQKAENALKRRLQARATGEELTSETRISVLAEVWFAKIDKAPGTMDAYRHTLDRHIIPKIGALQLREATTARLDRFLDMVATPTVEKVTNPATGHVRKIRHGGPTAAKQCRTVLSLMLGLAARYDAVPANPVRDTLLTAPKKRAVKAMTVEQFHELRADVQAWAAGGTFGPKRNAAVLDIMDMFIATGLRPGELLAFQFSDIDLRAGTAEVTGTIKRTRAEGLHRQPLPKSKHGERVLHLPAFAVTMLRERKMAAADKRGLVFTNRNGGIIEPANFNRLWRQARGERWEWVLPSSFRKAVATLIEREAGSLVASVQLGHSSDAVTRKHYIERNRDTPDSTAILARFRAGDAS